MPQHPRWDKTGHGLFKLLLRSCVALGKCSHLSEPQFLLCKMWEGLLSADVAVQLVALSLRQQRQQINTQVSPAGSCQVSSGHTGPRVWGTQCSRQRDQSGCSLPWQPGDILRPDASGDAQICQGQACQPDSSAPQTLGTSAGPRRPPEPGGHARCRFPPVPGEHALRDVLPAQPWGRPRAPLSVSSAARPSDGDSCPGG